MPIGLYEWTAVYLLLLLGWIYAPIYLRCGLTTVPEYFEQRCALLLLTSEALRFGTTPRVLLSSITLVAYVIRIATILYSGSILLEAILGEASCCAGTYFC